MKELCCTHRVDRTVPVRGSQNLIMLSLLPETSNPFVGCHSTHLTSQPWPRIERANVSAPVLEYIWVDKPVSTLSSLLSSNDQIRTVESSLAVANLPSSGLKLSPRIASLWPCHAVRLFILGWKYLITPLWSADARYNPECENCIVLTALSCACRMVSKLNVSPFQSVNSPLVEPVRMRRASGVHYEKISLGYTLGYVFVDLLLRSLQGT